MQNSVKLDCLVLAIANKYYNTRASFTVSSCINLKWFCSLLSKPTKFCLDEAGASCILSSSVSFSLYLTDASCQCLSVGSFLKTLGTKQALLWHEKLVPVAYARRNFKLSSSS